jgi:hypothetical protein
MKTIHHGKDGTVVGIAPITGRTNYFVSPVVLSPSCKTEKGVDLAQWIPNFISAYQQHPDGEARHGPIYTLATDGESSFRNLRFAIGMTNVLDPLSKEGEIIYRLSGMNRRTGARGLITTSDPKHIVKRFATLIRSPSGIQISDSLITTEMVGEALLLLDNMPREKVEQLLHPADKQNVPKAVNLLQSLFDLVGKHYAVTPAILERVQRVVFLARVLTCFLFPFIKVEMSLSEQLRSLSTYIHLLTAMYRKHRTAFVTSALYADSQAIVKNVIITIARMQTLDPTLEYHILFEGTDRLEGVFSHVRTQDHARNFDILQLAHKLSIGAEINAIFERCPDLDHGHVRRNLINARGVDHINPKSWTGNVCVGKVNIYNEYMAGRAAANELLMEQFGPASNVDFDVLFSNPKIDHLRPFGRYIGSNLDMDEDEQPVEPADVEVNENDEDVEGLTFTDISHDSGTFIPDSEPTHSSLPDTRDSLDDLEATENILHLEPEELNPIPEQPSQKILVDGVYIPKPTIVAKILSSEQGKKVTTRSLRARGIAISDALRRLQNLNHPIEDANSDDRIKSGDLGAFLVHVGDDVCLAVAEVLSFQKGTSKQALSSIHCDDLDATGSGLISIVIQVLHLHPKIAEDSGQLNYVWPKEYIQIQANKDGAGLMQRHFSMRVSGSQFFVLGPTLTVDEDGRPTWAICNSELEAVVLEAWSSICAEDDDHDKIAERVQQLPVIDTGFGLPYHDLNDRSSFRVDNLPILKVLTVGQKKAADKLKCHLCGKTVQLRDMRLHVGRHILLSLRECQDQELLPDTTVSAFSDYYHCHGPNMQAGRLL